LKVEVGKVSETVVDGQVTTIEDVSWLETISNVEKAY
jgi:hypothetical protein